MESRLFDQVHQCRGGGAMNITAFLNTLADIIEEQYGCEVDP